MQGGKEDLHQKNKYPGEASIIRDKLIFQKKNQITRKKNQSEENA